MKDLIRLFVVTLLCLGLWRQHNLAIESGLPQTSIWLKISTALPTESNKERRESVIREHSSYQFSKAWDEIISLLSKELITGMQQDDTKLRVEWTTVDDLSQVLNEMNDELRKLSKSDLKTDQRLGYLGQKFNKDLLALNRQRSTLQLGLDSMPGDSMGYIRGGKIDPAEIARVSSNSLKARWKKHRDATLPRIRENLAIVKQAEEEAKAAHSAWW